MPLVARNARPRRWSRVRSFEAKVSAGLIFTYPYRVGSVTAWSAADHVTVGLPGCWSSPRRYRQP